MCRNIKTLFNFDPIATDEEIQAAALQYVRKITGFNKPSKATLLLMRLQEFPENYLAHLKRVLSHVIVKSKRSVLVPETLNDLEQ